LQSKLFLLKDIGWQLKVIVVERFVILGGFQVEGAVFNASEELLHPFELRVVGSDSNDGHLI